MNSFAVSNREGVPSVGIPSNLFEYMLLIPVDSLNSKSSASVAYGK